jgi:hypothetical protein
MSKTIRVWKQTVTICCILAFASIHSPAAFAQTLPTPTNGQNSVWGFISDAGCSGLTAERRMDVPYGPIFLNTGSGNVVSARESGTISVSVAFYGLGIGYSPSNYCKAAWPLNIYSMVVHVDVYKWTSQGWAICRQTYSDPAGPYSAYGTYWRTNSNISASVGDAHVAICGAGYYLVLSAGYSLQNGQWNNPSGGPGYMYADPNPYYGYSLTP